MDNERTAVINIGDEEYTLLLTTKATKEIAGRYGGLENLGEKLMKSENFEMAIGEIVWLITLLANHPWYEITALAASPRSAGKTYEEAVGGRWKMQTPMPECVKKMAVMNVN